MNAHANAAVPVCMYIVRTQKKTSVTTIPIAHALRTEVQPTHAGD